jgi:hypothetical protein
VEATILEDKPTFRWPAVDGITSYSVEVSRLTHELLWEGKSGATTLTYSGETLLKPGFEYLWVVYGQSDTATRKELFKGKFDRATAGQADEADQMAKLLASDAGPAIRALAALWYEKNHLYAESINQYELLARSTSAPEFLAALSELYARAGRKEDAAKARAQAIKAGFKFAAPSAD